MVVQDKSILPRSVQRTQVSRGSQGLLQHETQCFYKALALDPFNLMTLSPSFISIIGYCLLFSMECVLLASIATYILKRTVLPPISIFVISGITLCYIIVSAYLYRKCLNKIPDYQFKSYMYVCMYSLVYFPFTIFFELMVPFLQFIFIIVMALASQYFISQNLLQDNFTFQSKKREFLFYICTIALQYAVMLTLNIYIISASGSQPTMWKKILVYVFKKTKILLKMLK